MPPVTAIALSGGTAAWLTADGGAACVDGKPARRARLQWRDDATPDVAHTVSITLDIASTAIGIAAALGLKNVPAGAKLHVYGKRAGDAGTTYDFGGDNTGTVRQFADGTYGAWFVLPEGATAVEQVEFRLYNDADGATWATPATTVDVGELVAMPAATVDAERDWAEEVIDPTESQRTLGAQPAAVPRQAYRTIAAGLAADGAGAVRGGALAGGADWHRLRAAMLGDRRVACVPRWNTADEINRTALYGTGRMGAAGHLTGDHYAASVSFQEVPALA